MMTYEVRMKKRTSKEKRTRQESNILQKLEETKLRMAIIDPGKRKGNIIPSRRSSVQAIKEH